MKKKHWNRPAFFSVEIKTDDINNGLVENFDCSRSESLGLVVIPNEVTRQAIQDAVNGVGMQIVSSMEEFKKGMEE